MAFQVRKQVFQTILTHAAICFGLSIVLTLATGGSAFELDSLMWLLGFAALMGMLAGWRQIRAIKTQLVATLSAPISYLRLQRSANDGIDWHTMDDYAVQLATRGFQKLGDFAYYPPAANVLGGVTCFSNAEQSIMVEVQQFRLQSADLLSAPQTGVQFVVSSLVAGNIHLIQSDQALSALSYLGRSDGMVFNWHPSANLLFMLDQHERQLESLQQRLGKRVSTGYNMLRYVLAQRGARAQALRRLQGTSAYQLVEELDSIDANMMRNWETASLQSVPEQDWSQLEAIAVGAAPALYKYEHGQIVAETEAANSEGHATEMSEPTTSVDLRKRSTAEQVEVTLQEIYANRPTAQSPHLQPDLAQAARQVAQQEALQGKVNAGASWFYWVAGLSLINLFAAALGTQWAFIFALNSAHILSAVAQQMPLLYLASFALIGLMAACGYFARRPSRIAFMLGMALYALDGLLLIYGKSWLNLIFHGYALYSLWNGLQAARQYANFSNSPAV